MFKGRGDSKTCGHAFELSPSGPHGLGARRFIVAIPAAKSGNDPGQPGQRMRRMGVFLAFGLALQRRAMASAADSEAASITSVAGLGLPLRASTNCIVRHAVARPTTASLNSR